MVALVGVFVAAAGRRAHGDRRVQRGRARRDRRARARPPARARQPQALAADVRARRAAVDAGRISRDRCRVARRRGRRGGRCGDARRGRARVSIWRRCCSRSRGSRRASPVAGRGQPVRGRGRPRSPRSPAAHARQSSSRAVVAAACSLPSSCTTALAVVVAITTPATLKQIYELVELIGHVRPLGCRPTTAGSSTERVRIFEPMRHPF